MKFLKTTFRNKLDTLANKITKDIQNYIIYNKDNNLQVENKEFNIIYNFKAPVKIILNISLYNGNNILSYCQYLAQQNVMDFLLNPNKYISKNRQIVFNIKIPNTFNKLNYDKLYKTLIEQIRHELQHVEDDDNLIQFKNFGKIDKYNVVNLISSDPKIYFYERIKYILSIIEQDAFIRGIILGAKKEKIEFNNKLKILIKENILSKDKIFEDKIVKQIGIEEVERNFSIIENKFMERAKQLFPNLKH